MQRPVKRFLRDVEWSMHEERIAKLRHELRESGVDAEMWDIGCSTDIQNDLAKLGLDWNREIGGLVMNCPDGFAIVVIDGVLNGGRVYVYKDSKTLRAEVGSRPDAVKLWGEDAILKFESLIGKAQS